MLVTNKAFDSLDPRFKPIVLDILNKLDGKGYQPIVAEGRRTQAQQDEKVRLGYSQTRKSIHLTGCAADIVDKRYMWDISNVHQFWWDLYQAAKSVHVTNGHLRYGLLWDHPEREAVYKKALDEKKPGLVTWFCDVAHIELHLN